MVNYGELQAYTVLLIELHNGFSSFPSLPSPSPVVVMRRKDKGKGEPHAVYFEEAVEI